MLTAISSLFALCSSDTRKTAGDYVMPDIPNIPPIPFSCFIILFISLNCFISRLTSETGRPLPLEIRARREPFSNSGAASPLAS